MCYLRQMCSRALSRRTIRRKIKRRKTAKRKSFERYTGKPRVPSRRGKHIPAPTRPPRHYFRSTCGLTSDDLTVALGRAQFPRHPQDSFAAGGTTRRHVQHRLARTLGRTVCLKLTENMSHTTPISICDFSLPYCPTSGHKSTRTVFPLEQTQKKSNFPVGTSNHSIIGFFCCRGFFWPIQGIRIGYP